MNTNNRAAIAQPTAGKSMPTWLQYLGLAVAGCASFAVAVYFSPAHNDDDGLELRVNRHRVPLKVRAEEARATPNAGNLSDGSPIIRTPNDDTSTNIYSDDKPARLSARVLKSPFDTLNLAASIDPPAPPVTQKTEKPARKKGKTTPPPAPAIVAEPPPPMAPALPFTVLGSIQGARIGDGKPMAFLSQHGVLLVAHAADVIDNIYRVESVTDKTIEFTYLPLRQKQSLPIPH